MENKLRVLIFIALKIAEISAIVFIPYFVGSKAVLLFIYPNSPPSIIIWFVGFVLSCVMVMAALLLYLLLRPFIEYNWELSYKIINMMEEIEFFHRYRKLRGKKNGK